MSEAGRLYFATGVDIDPAVEDEFNEWYDTDHLPSVVACPGFLWGCRYRVDHRDSPRYWVVYEVESREALGTPELQAISGFGRFTDAISNQQIRWFRSLTPVLRHDPGPG